MLVLRFLFAETLESLALMAHVNFLAVKMTKKPPKHFLKRVSDPQEKFRSIPFSL